MRPFAQRTCTTPLDEVTVRCYPGADGQTGTSVLYEDDGITLAYRKGECARTRLNCSRAGNRFTIKIDPAEGSYGDQPQVRAYTIELPATRPANSITVDEQPAKGIYMPGESLNIIKIPARSIRRGCTVTVVANEDSPEDLKAKAFAHRAGLPVPAPGTTVKSLLASALGAGLANPQSGASTSAALAAAVGIGLFDKNETLYGYPDTRTLRAYVPSGLGVQIEPVVENAEPPAGRSGKSFKLYLDGAAFALKNPPVATN